jgi:Holliday junction DNA helicase RuvA
MIHHLKGKLIEVNPTHAVVECGGVGYMVNISLQTYSAIAASNEIKLYIYPVYKEDAQTLFGFYQRDERALFSLLISVSGVGGNTARVILSSLSSEEVQQAIAGENVNLLKSIKGIGAKTAERIIVDLKDKVGGVSLGGTAVSTSGSNASEAIAALEVLGYSPRQTEKIILGIQREDANLAVQDLIKAALKKL